MDEPETTLAEDALQARLDYRFASPLLLRQALTHRSFINESGEPATAHNERLEFLGDAVVDLAVGHWLMESLPDAREGQLSKLRAMIVNEASLARVSEELELGACLRLGKGEEQTGGRQKSSILADAFEAVMGAIYLDGGYARADQIVHELLETTVTRAVRGDLDGDHKTHLQELVQARSQMIPRYEVIGEAGPDHAKTFQIAVFVGDDQLASAWGGSKKEAEQGAARAALERLDQG